MLRALAGLLLASLLAVPLLAPSATARDGPLAAPRSVGDGSLVEWEGTSALRLAGACAALLRTCVGSAESEEGRFFLPASGSDGTILVWWDAVHPSLRTLRVEVGDRVVEGTSPVAISLPGAQPGEYRVRVAPAKDVVGRHEQPVGWRASFHVAAPVPYASPSGRASYATLTGCALSLCDATTLSHDSDPLVAPWTALGTLTASWPSDTTLRVSIPGTTFAAVGRSPLALNVDGLAPGEWRVQVDPASAAIPLGSASVLWEAKLTRSP